ncbi:f-box DNA helicase 1 [Trichonephila clavata]|uniref:DNA 3'-5' helicase n=1 Tax=Trichonephila clavata TaxID=2740835 RepID=A0A8X6GHS5_TRICU|nr:f-box DNA helicase 1 [Trichonephila clavata]
MIAMTIFFERFHSTLMMSSTPKQPRKKRRIDAQESKGTDESPEVLPLDFPNEVAKNSENPNQDIHPSNDRAQNRQSLSYSFVNAADLLRESSERNNKSEISVEVDIEVGGISNQGESSNTQQKEANVKYCIEASLDGFQKSPNLNEKITSYFKVIPDDSSKKKKIVSDTAESNSKDIPGTSGYQFHSEKSPKIEPSEDSNEERNDIFFKRIHNYFGLLGEENEDEEEQPNYFERLPCHILEAIFCQLPNVELLKIRTVCSAWRAVINDAKFMEWKKRYYSMHLVENRKLMEGICADNGLKEVEDCFKVLLKFMFEEFNKKPSSDMYTLLMEIPKAVQAELVIAERFPELLKKEAKVWAIFAATLILSETVEDVCDVYRKLLSFQSNCSRHDIIDAFYCVATFFYHFKNFCGINHGLHYRVYCALYWFENELPSKNVTGSQSMKVVTNLPGQQSLHSYCESTQTHLTNEQIRILNHCFQPGQIIKIVALAGTGKTTTLIHLAQLYPQVKFLNVMFNKAVCEEAKKRFPPNVTCRTAHSLAYTVYGHRLRYKLTTKIRAHDLLPLLEHQSGCITQPQSYAKYVLRAIERFISSTDVELDLSHVGAVEDNLFSEEEALKIWRDATQIWRKMIDRDNKEVKVTHDVYLKLYQLSKPRLVGFQCLMVDEAQDCNPVIIDIMMSQNLPVIFVGDPNQQIYGFRGAKSALKNINSTHTYYLSKSFRFGPQIAYVASCFLDVLKPGQKEILVGSNKPSRIDGRAEGQYAIITRTNVQLFNEAFRICCQGRIKPNEPSVIHGCFVGGLKSYGFDQMLDICKLISSSSSNVAQISDKFIARFKTYKDLTSYAREVEDNDLLAKLDIVNQHGSRIPEFIRIIKEKCSHTMALANIIFSTAHKAKGLEFDTVCLTDDYPVAPGIDYRRRHYGIRLSVPGNNTSVVDLEETNIMYVALTRAKRSLVLPDKVLRVLLAAQEKFEYPVAPSSLLNGENRLECVSCCESFTPHTALILARRRMYSANGRIIQGGALCMKCGTEPTVRPRVQIEPVVMYLDPTADYAHRSMAAFVGPLPTDPPIVRDSFAAFHEMDVVYVINLNVSVLSDSLFNFGGEVQLISQATATFIPSLREGHDDNNNNNYFGGFCPFLGKTPMQFW